MIEAILDLVPKQGEALPAPGIDTLRTEYFYAGNILVGSEGVSNPAENCNRVITLRPDVKLNFSSVKVDFQRVHGYFAYGSQEGACTNFQVFSPHPRIGVRFPPKALEFAIEVFRTSLLREGYTFGDQSLVFIKNTSAFKPQHTKP